MKKKRQIECFFLTTLYLLLCFIGVSPVFALDSQQTDTVANIKFVSTTGRDHARGTIDDPLATLQVAADCLANRTTKEHPGQVIVRGGDYHLTNSIILNKENSFVTYSPFKNEKVVIHEDSVLANEKFVKLSDTSGERFRSKSRLNDQVKSKIYVYDLKSEHIPVGTIKKNGFNWQQQAMQPELIVDGKIQKLAQYPNGNDDIRRNKLLAGVEKNEERVAQLTAEEKANYDAAKKAGASAEHASGEVPRNYYFDKTDSPKSYEEMLAMKAPVFYAADAALRNRMAKWAPETLENETQDNQPERTEIDSTKFETDGWLTGYFENNYANDMVKIYSIDNEKHLIHTKYPTLQGVQDKNLQLTAVNLLSELDTPGEYYIDRYEGNDVLFYYPEEKEFKNKRITLTSLEKPLFQLNETMNINLSNLILEGGTSYGLELLDATSCNITNCECLNFSLDAIKIGQNNRTITADPSYTTNKGGHDNHVNNCFIHDMGGGGVYLAGGNEKTLERGNNSVSNCEIANISRWKTYTPAVYLEGVGNSAENNYIHDAPHVVIQIMGNDMLVTKNKIENTCTNASDMAPIYAGRSWNWLGNVISYNYIKGVKSENNYGIYLDDNMSGVTITNNIFEDISSNPIFSNKGYGQKIVNNLMITENPGINYESNNASISNRPIPNEKVLDIRWSSMLQVGGGNAYTNTSENVETWIHHYRERYPYLEKRYIPDQSDPTQGSDLDSCFVPSYQILNHQIFVGNGDSIKASKTFILLQDARFDTDNFRVAAIEELKINMETGKFALNSPLSQNAAFGNGWIQNWNDHFDLSRCGIQK